MGTHYLTVESVAQPGTDLEEEIRRLLTPSGDQNMNAAGTNVLLSDGFMGMDPLIAVKDCSCKSPLLDSLKKQTEALVKEKGDSRKKRKKRR